MDEMFAIKCQNCGGPMYSHQAKRSFECAYCGAVIPWQADAGEPKSALGIRHTPLTVVDGLLKLTHVSQLERPEDPDWYFFNSHWRNQSVLEHLLWEDRGTAQEFQEATHVSIPCPFCGASFEGESTQRVFECPSCGNKIGVADLLKPGTFSKRLTMGVGAEYVPEQGIPCEITPQQARANALELVRRYPDAFAGHDVEDAIQNDMMLFYFPMALADLRMMASFPGKGLSKETLVYYEVLDWAYPRANYLDVRLMGILEPWDFAKVGSFDPAMQEGDFRVVSVDASTKDQVVIDKLALDFDAGIATMDGEELHLTPIEYKLLCLLAHNADKVLTHQFILHEIWGTATKSDLASLRVFMGTLRKKIESDPAHPRYIQTHVGIGYRLVTQG